MNVVVISGGLGRDPEVKQTQSGSTIMNFSVAVSDRRKNGQTGQWEEVTHWVDCVMFGKRAESLSRFLRKGMKVTISGRLQQNRWEDKQGNKRSKIEVVANDVELPPRGQGQPQPSQGDYNQQPNNYTNQGQYGPQNGSQGFSGGYQKQSYQQPPMDVYDEDCPF